MQCPTHPSHSAAATKEIKEPTRSRQSDRTNATLVGLESPNQTIHETGSGPDHGYYQAMILPIQNMPASESFFLDGTNYTYATADISNGQGGITVSPGEQGWEHMLIHNDLISGFGVDNTGALQEGLQNAQNAPSQNNLPQDVQANRSTQGSPSMKVSPPPMKGVSCKSPARYWSPSPIPTPTFHATSTPKPTVGPTSTPSAAPTASPTPKPTFVDSWFTMISNPV